MAVVKATHLLVIRGDTRPAKETLKKAGWAWNPEAKHWYMRLVPAHADLLRSEIETTNKFLFESLKGNRKGCQVTLDGIVVWTSKTFSGQACSAPIQERVKEEYDIYDCDAYGNPVRSPRIPGSEDRI